MNKTFTEKFKKTTIFTNGASSDVAYLYYDEYPDTIILADCRNAFVITDIENLDKYSEDVVDMIHRVRIQEYYNKNTAHIYNMQYSPGETLTSIVMKNSNIYRQQLHEDIINPLFHDYDDLSVIKDTAFGNNTHYVYIKKYPDIIFPINRYNNCIGFILIDAGMNMSEMDDVEIINLQKNKYMCYRNNTQDCLCPLDCNATNPITTAIVNNSSIYANLNTEDVVSETSYLSAIESENEKTVNLDEFIDNMFEENKDSQTVKAVENIPNFYKKEPKHSSKHIIDIDGHVYENYIRSAVEKGVINTDKNFKPDSYITRGQLAVIICRILDSINN